MTFFDFFILSILGLSGLFGWIRGGSRELVTLLAIGVSVLSILLFGEGFSGLFGDGSMAWIIGYAVLFTLAFIVASVVFEIIVSKIWGRTPQRPDKLAGIAVGLVRGWLVTGLAYLAMTYYFIPEDMPDGLLNGVATSAADLLETLGLKREASGDVTSDLTIE